MNTGQTARMIARVGQTVTLRRTDVDDLAVKAVVRLYRPENLGGEIIQGDRQVVISDAEIAAASWPGPPRKGDRLLIDSRTATVQAVETRRLGDAIDRHIIQARG